MLEQQTYKAPKFSLPDIAETFKDQKTVVKREIKNIDKRLQWFLKLERKINDLVDNRFRSPIKNKFAKEFLLELHVNIDRKNILKRKKELSTILAFMSPQKKVTGGVNEQEIERARQMPISDIIEFNRFGFANSIWNSDDKTPSMKYYPSSNKVKCYSTGNHGSVIDVVMVLYNYDFVKAVKEINNNRISRHV